MGGGEDGAQGGQHDHEEPCRTWGGTNTSGSFRDKPPSAISTITLYEGPVPGTPVDAGYSSDNQGVPGVCHCDARVQLLPAPPPPTGTSQPALPPTPWDLLEGPELPPLLALSL